MSTVLLVLLILATAFAGECECEDKDCGCCEHVKVKHYIDGDVCANVTYNKANLTLTIELSLDGKAIWEEVFDAENPPDICFGVPYLKDIVKLCIKVYDLKWEKDEISGCVKFEVKVIEIGTVFSTNLGCFHFDADIRRIPEKMEFVPKKKRVWEKHRIGEKSKNHDGMGAPEILKPIDNLPGRLHGPSKQRGVRKMMRERIMREVRDMGLE